MSKKQSKQEKQKGANNIVAKYAHQFNRSSVFVDRKKAQKRGERKHKQRSFLAA